MIFRICGYNNLYSFVNYREAEDLAASDNNHFNNVLLSSFSSLLRRYPRPLLVDLRFTTSPRLYSFVPNEREFNPCLRMFLEAFKSLSCSIPHLGQVHFLSDKFNDSLMKPQLEQVLDEGTLKNAKRLGSIIATCVIHDGNSESFPFCADYCLSNGWNIVSGCHEIYVMRTVMLQAEHYVSKRSGINPLATDSAGDIAILAKDTTERAARKKYRSGAASARNYRFFPLVKRRTRHVWLGRHTAISHGFRSVNAAMPMTKVTFFVVHRYSSFLLLTKQVALC